MTNVFAVVGQHRVEPGRLLLLGDDGRYYAYDAAGRPTEVAPSSAWMLDADERTVAPAAPAASPRSATRPRGAAPATRRFRLALPTRSDARRQVLALVAGLAILLGSFAVAPAAVAHAPALAVATGDAALLAAPDATAPVVATIADGTEVELTGAAATDFLEVLAGGSRGWVAIGSLDDGRFATATATLNAPIQAGPRPDAEALGIVPAGGTVILTVAAADGYVAGSFDGVGGWIRATDLT